MRTPVAGWLALIVMLGLFTLVSHTMRALRAVAYPANAVPVRLEINRRFPGSSSTLT
jgi:hypothetical protein